MNAYWVMVALVSAFGIVDGSLSLYFGLSRRYCVERTETREDEKPETELKEISLSSVGSLPPQPSGKKTPSPVSLTHDILNSKVSDDPTCSQSGHLY